MEAWRLDGSWPRDRSAGRASGLWKLPREALSIIDSIFRGGLQLKADVSGAPAPWDDFWYQPAGGHASSSGMRVTPETSKRLSTVVACVSWKSRQPAMMPCKIYTDIAGGGKRVVTNHPLYDVLYSTPNELQTAFEFKQMMQSHVELRGNAYAEKIPGPRGPVDQLIPMHPDRVTVEVLKNSGRLRYIYNDPLTGGNRVLMQDEVFHLREFCDNSAVGQSRIALGLDLFGVALARQDYIARFLKNDGRSGWAITGFNPKDGEADKEFRRKIQSGQTGENRGKVLILPPGLDIKAMSVTPVEAQLLDSVKASAVEICTMFNVLPHQVGVDAGKAATYASVEQFNIMSAVQSVLPMLIMWEQAIQRDLITDSRYYAKFSMAALLRGDTATRFAAYNTALAAGWMCQDDVRELEDMNPIPDGVGKTFWRPANWSPLKQLTNPQPIPFGGKPAPGGNDDQDEDQETNEGSGSGDAEAKAGRLKLLATSAADRCVRREISGVKRLIDQSAGAYEITEFYAEQVRFIVGVFNLDAAGELAVKVACDGRAQQLTMLLSDEDDEFHAAAQVWIEQVGATEPIKLVTLAVEGAK
jgi:HK97 family phage portal protein